MKQFISEISLETCGEGFTDLTNKINHWVLKTGIYQGIITITTKHTSCSLIINENADPKVLEDLSTYFKSLVPEGGFQFSNTQNKFFPYKHSEEGLDDMPAHIKTALTCSSLSLSINKNKLILGTWQAVYLWEHRYQKHFRKICLHAIGEDQKDQSPKA